MMRLNSQVQPYGGFTPGRRVFGRTPQLPIGPICNPFLGYFMNLAGAPTAKRRNLISAIYEIRHASLTAHFQNKLNTTLIRRAMGAKMGNFVGRSIYFVAANRKNKEDRGLGRAGDNHSASW